MAANLMQDLMRWVFSILLSTASLVVSANELLTDPTRLPAELSVLPISGVRANIIPASIILQSIIISPERRAAIINGQTVKVGDLVNNETLIEVNEDNVVLKGNRGKIMLTLFPGVKILKKNTVKFTENKNSVNFVKKKSVIKKHRPKKPIDHTMQSEKIIGNNK